MWFKVDDQLAFHPKVMAAGNEAIGLWVRAGAWCSAYLTDGRIPKAVAHSMASDMANAIALANSLVMAKLWVDDGDHYVFHDWEEFQPSASKALARREEISEKRKLAGQKGAKARWSKTDDGKSDGKCHSKSHGKSHGKTMAPEWQNDGPVPVPVPSLSPNGERAPARAKRKRPARPLPDDWQPRDQERQTATAKGIDPDALAHDMRNWAQAKDERRVDWDATFRTFISRERPSRNTDPLNPWQQAFNDLAADEYLDHHMIEGAP